MHFCVQLSFDAQGLNVSFAISDGSLRGKKLNESCDVSDVFVFKS